MPIAIPGGINCLDTVSMLRYRAIWLVLIATACGIWLAAARGAVVLVPVGATWRYLDTGSDLATAWRAPTFSDTAWPSGRAQLGYGDGDETIEVRYGSDPNNKHVTTYFRHAFTVADRNRISNLAVRLLRDDGGVVYLNGVEVFRSNMPQGPITYDRLAASSIGTPDETNFFAAAVPPEILLEGLNVLAVEIHQAARDSSDLSFDLELLGNTPSGNLPPLVEIPNPTTGLIVATNEPFPLGAIAWDADSSISDLAVHEDETLLGWTMAEKLYFPWSNSVPGVHTYVAHATDAQGAVGESPPVRVLVNPPGMASVFFPEFTATDGVIRQGSALVVANWIRLAAPTSGYGAVWLTNRQWVTRGFETVFQFRINNLINGGADGLAFIIYGAAQPAIGSPLGGDLVYGGLTNSLAVEFDTYLNTDRADPNHNHIGIHSRGTAANTAHESAALGRTTSIADLSDGAAHTVMIRYTPGVFRVFLDDLHNPILTVNANLGSLSLPDGRAWVGIAGATGGRGQHNELLWWAFSALTPPPPRLLRIQPEADGALLLEFSSAPGWNYAIEYSPDLREWMPVVPAVTGRDGAVPWRDAGPPLTVSPPFSQPQRFYRVRVEF